MEKESHLAGGDAAISSPKLIASGLEFAVAGQEFHKRTPFGFALLEKKHFKAEDLYQVHLPMANYNFFSQTFGPEDSRVISWISCMSNA